MFWIVKENVRTLKERDHNFGAIEKVRWEKRKNVQRKEWSMNDG